MKKWQCTVCKYIHQGDAPPEKCPICGVPASKFILLADEGQAAAGEKTPASEAKKKAAAAKTAPAPEPEPKTAYDKLVRFMVKHHAHPVSVHMPNGLVPVSVVLFILAWLFGTTLFVKAGFINLVFVVLSLPLVLYSGVMEWKKKYNSGMTLIFKIKILAAATTTTACLICVVWYMIDPGVLASSKAWAFILINLIMLAGAGIAGHMGGKLVFKD
jgi:uncharacterized membrane protein